MAVDLSSDSPSDALDEVVVELKRLADNYKALDDHVESLNKHTVKAQVDVEMLLNRSSNNNKHLQTMSQLGQSVDRVLEQVQQLQKQQKSQEEDKSKHERLEALDREILAKERRAAALDADYRQMKQRLSEKHDEFAKLQRDFQDFQLSMNQQLKNAMGGVMVSSGALLDDATPKNTNNNASSRMHRITSMLREKYNLENGSRRVVSTDSVFQPQMRTRKKYVLNPNSLQGSPVTPERSSFNSDDD
ncbi:ZYRO0C06666p [Zygosaccharomyces rouxii]|uniref:ZYRO0C06666p n=1 Tax=Zygosaccharomyces rouxii (strain ATCC 2623 / CBS 732 / NBRC 1130 / NCYC 568 / NRRL Y-229) TaxID=559307 RepID=C5DT96_ZYGRC|nr:uncharacterized protein ZYRO0C06666g [Zygosaccharomyces rouxii]KAH9201813.1 hypothetical protein LQ764DRAFT_227199 [Zygosaccharomyces rouxii]CAR27007.1 ZYRO0C06666p [Zygosaccharomyces rouxii]